MTQNWISSCYRVASPWVVHTSGHLPPPTPRKFRYCANRESLLAIYLRTNFEQFPDVITSDFLKGRKGRGGGSINSRAKAAYMWIVFSDYSAPEQHTRRCWARLNNYWTFSSNKFHATNPACRLGIDNSIGSCGSLNGTATLIVAGGILRFRDTYARVRMYILQSVKLLYFTFGEGAQRDTRRRHL